MARQTIKTGRKSHTETYRGTKLAEKINTGAVTDVPEFLTNAVNGYLEKILNLNVISYLTLISPFLHCVLIMQ